MENYSKFCLCNINILFIKACELPYKSGMNVFSHTWLVIAKEKALLLTVRRVSFVEDLVRGEFLLPVHH